MYLMGKGVLWGKVGPWESMMGQGLQKKAGSLVGSYDSGCRRTIERIGLFEVGVVCGDS